MKARLENLADFIAAKRVGLDHWREHLARHLLIWREAWRADLARPRIARNRDELEFLPAALELVESPASPAGRAVLWSIMGFFSLALLWALIGELDIHATAQGRVIPSGHVKTLQPAEIGMVTAIHVKDGQHVKAGQLLIELDPTSGEADSERHARDLLEARVKAARLKAQLTADPEMAFAPPAEAPAELTGLHRRLLGSRMAEQRATLGGLDREREQREAETKSIRTDISRLEATLPLLRERATAKETLVGQGHAGRLQYLELKESLLDREHELRSSREKLGQVIAALANIAERKSQNEAKFLADAMAELAETERQAETSAQELRKAVRRSESLKLIAPVDGTVQQLAVHTVGGVVTPAQPVLVVVPDEGGVEIEAMLPNKDAGFVSAGQEVEIKVETFPFTRYGTLPGSVLHVSRDAMGQTEGGAGKEGKPGNQTAAQAAGSGPVYAVRVRLVKPSIMVDGLPQPLLPGMAVTAEIKTGTRKLIEYLLSPIIRYASEGLRER